MTYFRGVICLRRNPTCLFSCLEPPKRLKQEIPTSQIPSCWLLRNEWKRRNKHKRLRKTLHNIIHESENRTIWMNQSIISKKHNRKSISLLAIRRKRPSCDGWFRGDCFCHCDDYEFDGCCFNWIPFQHLKMLQSLSYIPLVISKFIQ